jgi:hypothetical protein
VSQTPPPQEPPGSAAPGWPAAPTGTSPPPPPAAAPPQPPGWVAPPAPKRRLTWLWILLGALLLVAALVVVAVIFFIRSISGPIDATNDLLAAVEARDYATAYELSCSDVRERYTQEQFTRALESAFAQNGALTDYDVNFSTVDGSEATVRYDVRFERGPAERYEARVVKESGDWRPCLFDS